MNNNHISKNLPNNLAVSGDESENDSRENYYNQLINNLTL